jgi:hypothetical protein
VTRFLPPELEQANVIETASSNCSLHSDPLKDHCYLRLSLAIGLFSPGACRYGATSKWPHVTVQLAKTAHDPSRSRDGRRHSPCFALASPLRRASRLRDARRYCVQVSRAIDRRIALRILATSKGSLVYTVQTRLLSAYMGALEANCGSSRLGNRGSSGGKGFHTSSIRPIGKWVLGCYPRRLIRIIPCWLPQNVCIHGERVDDWPGLKWV